jgi:hypothetical protein
MAKNDKTTLAAQKARKQKIIAAVASVVLLGIVAIQGPKLWKQLNPPAPQESSAIVSPATPSAPAGSATSAPPAAGRPSATNAVLAGVWIRGGVPTRQAQDGKLVSFSLFEVKDPFVPQVTDGSPGTSPSTGPPAASTTNPASPSQPPTTSVATTAPPKPTYATIEVNGKAQATALKEKFPVASPAFVLVGLTRSTAKIGVAGGAFESGKTLALKMGKQVTLVDTATGVRYELKLVYSGSAPEKTQTFTSEPTQTQASP